MRLFSKHNISEICFPDIDVLKMVCNIPDKKIIVYLQGAYLINTKEDLGKGVITFSNWEFIQNDKWDPDSKSWIFMSHTKIEEMENLIEFDYVDSTIIARGFAKHLPEWVKLTIVNPEISGEFEEPDAE